MRRFNLLSCCIILMSVLCLQCKPKSKDISQKALGSNITNNASVTLVHQNINQNEYKSFSVHYLVEGDNAWISRDFYSNIAENMTFDAGKTYSFAVSYKDDAGNVVAETDYPEKLGSLCNPTKIDLKTGTNAIKVAICSKKNGFVVGAGSVDVSIESTIVEAVPKLSEWCSKKDIISSEQQKTLDIILKKLQITNCTEADSINWVTTSLEIINENLRDLTPFASLRGMTSLTIVNSAKGTIEDISPLRFLSGLQYLSLNNQKITNISNLANLVHLKTLSLKGNNISLLEQKKCSQGVKCEF